MDNVPIESIVKYAIKFPCVMCGAETGEKCNDLWPKLGALPREMIGVHMVRYNRAREDLKPFYADNNPRKG